MRTILIILCAFLGLNSFAADTIRFWSGISGTASGVLGGVVQTNSDCSSNTTMAIINRTDDTGPLLEIYGGFCALLSISADLKNQNGVLFIQDERLDSTWSSPDLFKPIGTYDGRSFDFKFSIVFNELLFTRVTEAHFKPLSASSPSGSYSFSVVDTYLDGKVDRMQVSGSLKQEVLPKLASQFTPPET